MREPELIITPEMLRLIAEVDEFKGKWAAFKNLSPDRLSSRRVYKRSAIRRMK
jgi:hypothetical protein